MFHFQDLNLDIFAAVSRVLKVQRKKREKSCNITNCSSTLNALNSCINPIIFHFTCENGNKVGRREKYWAMWFECMHGILMSKILYKQRYLIAEVIYVFKSGNDCLVLDKESFKTLSERKHHEGNLRLNNTTIFITQCLCNQIISRTFQQSSKQIILPSE